MTLRQCYEFALIECNKLKAPALLLEDYIYLFNKAIQQKINEIYNRYDINQQSSDDLRVLQTTATIIPKRKEDSMLNDNIWVVELPKDYLHLLNCVAEFEGNISKNLLMKIPGVSKVEKVTDYLNSNATGLPPANVLIYALEGGASVVIRPSGTEPVIRIMVEGANEIKIKDVAERIKEYLEV